MMNYRKYLASLIIIVQVIIFSACGNESLEKEVNNDYQEISQSYSYEENHLFIENDGREVPFVFTEPLGKEKSPLVVMYHGFGGSKDEGNGFIRIARMLAEEGIATIRMDFPGCGESKTSFMDYNLNNNISDGNACLNYILDNKPIDREQIGLLGYSMGGATAVLETSKKDHPYKALVLLAPGTPTNEDRIIGNDRLMAIAEEKGYYELEWFGRLLHVSPEYYRGLSESFNLFDEYDNRSMDCILIYGDKDDIVLPEYSKEFAEQIDVEAIEIKEADHGYGFYSEEPEVTNTLEYTIGSFFEEKLLNE